MMKKRKVAGLIAIAAIVLFIALDYSSPSICQGRTSLLT